MPRTAGSPKDRAKRMIRFRNLVDEFRQAGRSTDRSVKDAAEVVGISKSTAYRWFRGDHHGTSGDTNTNQLRKRGVGFIPDPIPYDKLSDLAKRMIAPDGYPLFLEKVFGWHLVPWELKAAKVSVDQILDKGERHYGIANQPPGSGKSSNWTFALPVWLNLGGGFEDPERGRRLRFQLGHASKEMSKLYTQRIQRLYESPRVFYDTKTGRYGEVVIAKEFGRLRPLQSMGDATLWQDKQFIVAQMEDVDLANQEPTFMAVSPGAEFIGGRCEYAVWDDLVTDKLSQSVEQVDKLAEWFEKEGEQRIEPGGILWLVGQRIASFDLFRNRLDVTYVDENDDLRKKYFHIVFPVHYEPGCEADSEQGGDHRQWNAETDDKADGCLLDAGRLPWRDILKVSGSPHFRTVFQQEDIDPVRTLVTKLMLEGGTGYEPSPATGKLRPVEYPGCLDKDRAFGEFPGKVGDFVDYVTVDPATGGKKAGSDWAIEWWETKDAESMRYLVWGTRRIMQAGDLLDWDQESGRFVGWMEYLQQASVRAHRPIRAWVIEAVGAFKVLFQYRHFERWKDRWPNVEVIPHETQKNKWDPTKGVEALLRRKYRGGLASIPYKRGMTEGFNFITDFMHQLTTWTATGKTRDDTVMADWFGEARIEDIIRAGTNYGGGEPDDGVKLPPYLMRRRMEEG